MLPEDTQIGRYRIRRRIAQGGMGALYLAEDPVLGRDVAVKVFLGDLDLPDAREQFVREARSAAALSHPNIVTIYDYGEYESQPYMVMEFIQGQTLADLIRRRAAIPDFTKLRWMEELCSAVHYAHAHGVIHRDIKPLNLVADAYGRLKVLDFGIARMRGSLASHATARVGTAGYMAPEQVRGGNVDHRSDLFSIGVVLYELLSYVEPFAAEIDVAVTHRILEDEPTPLQEVAPSVDPELAAIVWKALRKDPADRYQDGESVRAALAAVRRQLEAMASDSGVHLRPVSGADYLATVSPAASPNQPPAPSVPGDGGRAPTGPAAERAAERAAVVQKRTAVIRQSLGAARQLWEAGELAKARTECEHVLQLDAAHPEALALARLIEIQLARDEASAVLRRGHEALGEGAVTRAQDLLERARTLAPDQAEISVLDRALRLARAQQAVDRRRQGRFRQALQAGQAALDADTPEEALSHAREALEIDPASTEARALERDSLRRIDADTGPLGEDVRTAPGRSTGSGDSTMFVPRALTGGSTGGATAQTGVPATDAPGGGTPSPRPGGVPKGPRARSRGPVAALIAVGVMALVAVGWLVWPESTAPATPPVAASVKTVVVDAVPWGTVREVRLDGGEPIALPDPRDTPLVLSLSPGLYHLTLDGPQGADGRRPETKTTYEVKADGEPGIVSAEFPTMTAEAYFLKHLGAPAPPPALNTGGGR